MRLKVVVFFLSFIHCCLATQVYGLAQWTVMVYLDGDNNLEQNAIDDFLEMAQVGSTSQVNIVVQFDRIRGYDFRYNDWTETHRFYVTRGITPTLANAISDWGDGKGGREVNMGSPETLVDFVSWAMQNYPAGKYALILWDHGNGWKSVQEEINSLNQALSRTFSQQEKNQFKQQIRKLEEKLARWKIEKSVCSDTTSGDNLTLKELKLALEQLPGSLNIIGFDACLMGMIEVAYEIRDFASVMVASEEFEYVNGWPFHTILGDLASNPLMMAEQLASVMVERYWQENGFSGPVTLSAIRLGECFSLRHALDNLISALQATGEWIAVHIGLGSTKRFDDPDYKDLRGFLQGCLSGASDPTLRQALQQALAQFDLTIILSCGPDGTNGLSIYLPDYGHQVSQLYAPEVVTFAESSWDEFLLSFQQIDPFSGLEFFWEETFGQGQPLGWTVVDGYSDGKTWSFTNPGGRSIPGFTAPFVIVDSDWAGRVDMDESLITPVISLPVTKCYLIFEHFFKFYSLGKAEKGDLDIREEGGEWETLISFADQDASGLVIINLRDYLGKRVQLRWHYYNANYDWYWAIDNVRIMKKPGNQAEGDINQDGLIDIFDVILCLRMCLGIIPVNLEMADVDGSGTVDIRDVIIILEKSLRN
ncbi:MAG: clostripain-related cysteine peptidase [Candidatus Omnitrophica bacterium]|nr:clostripain-related cysteine peptidase [Candidatus Omnitrophota bacterium]